MTRHLAFDMGGQAQSSGPFGRTVRAFWAFRLAGAERGAQLIALLSGQVSAWRW